MNRNPRDPDAEILLPPHGTPPPLLTTHMPCRYCGVSTLKYTLNHYGARCLRCYEAYLLGKK